MANQSNIKWRDKDRKKIASVVRAFNSKRTRLIKQVPELVDFLPPKMISKEIQAGITTRREFNRTVASLERFLRPGAEKTISTKGGVKTTVWQKKEAEIKLRILNRQRKKRHDKASPVTGTMNTIERMALEPKKNFAWGNENRTEKDWAAFLKAVEKQSKDSYWANRDKIYRENYLKATKDQWGDKRTKEMRAIIEGLSAEDIVDAQYFSSLLAIDFLYPEDDEKMTDTWDSIIEMWMEYLNKYKGKEHLKQAKKRLKQLKRK